MSQDSPRRLCTPLVVPADFRRQPQQPGTPGQALLDGLLSPSGAHLHGGGPEDQEGPSLLSVSVFTSYSSHLNNQPATELLHS